MRLPIRIGVQDVTIPFVIKQKDGTEVSPSSFKQVFLELKTTGGKIIQKFAYPSVTDYKTIEIDGNNYICYLSKEETTGNRPDDLNFNLTMQFDTDKFPDNDADFRINAPFFELVPADWTQKGCNSNCEVEYSECTDLMPELVAVGGDEINITVGLGGLTIGGGTGSGDMLKSVYDTNNNGVVDNSERLGGQLPAYYAKIAGGNDFQGNQTVSFGNLSVQGAISGSSVDAKSGIKLDPNGTFLINNVPPGYDSLMRVLADGRVFYIPISDFATSAQGDKADSALQTVATDATISGDGTVGNPLSAVTGGSGDVTGPESSTDNNLPAFDGITGKVIKDSGIGSANQQLSNVKSVNLDTAPPTITSEGQVAWNGDLHTIKIISGVGATINVGMSTYLLYYNDTGATISAGTVLHLKSATSVNGYLIPTPELADASKWEMTQGTLSVACCEILNGELGFSVIYAAELQNINTLGVAAGAQLWLSDDGSGTFTDVKPTFPSYSISIGGSYNSDVSGKILVNITKDIYDTFGDAFDGGFRESINFTVSSDGTTITGSLENVDNTKDLTAIFSDGFYTLDTTPAATIALTAGTDTNPQINYVYFDKSTKALQVSTSDWPTTEHIKIADLLLQSALTTQTDSALVNRNWNDHLKSEGNNGHLLHISERIRQNHAEWDSGTEAVCTVTGGTTVDVSVMSGTVYQLHKETFPAFNTATGSHVHVPNHFTSPYIQYTNLENIISDALGNSYNNTSYSWVLWGVQNKSGQPSKLMINVPIGTYSKNTPENAVSDPLNYSVYDIPKAFKGKGFLIARFTFVNSNGLISLYSTEDLRGSVPNASAGGGIGGGGVVTFTGLTDTFNSYLGLAGQFLRVNATETGVETFSANNVGLRTVAKGSQATTTLAIDVSEGEIFTATLTQTGTAISVSNLIVGKKIQVEMTGGGLAATLFTGLTNTWIDGEDSTTSYYDNTKTNHLMCFFKSATEVELWWDIRG